MFMAGCSKIYRRWNCGDKIGESIFGGGWESVWTERLEREVWRIDWQKIFVEIEDNAAVSVVAFFRTAFNSLDVPLSQCDSADVEIGMGSICPSRLIKLTHIWHLASIKNERLGFKLNTKS
jgi:hypothetical protein